MIKYNLMSRQGPDREQARTTSMGAFLVQHLRNRAIRVEVIPGKDPDEVSGFSDAALIYRR